MPVINQIWVATLRRHWPLLGALGIYVVFTVSHQFVFLPAAKRYQAAVKQATELGMPLDPGSVPSMLPPRLFALLSDNALSEAEAQEQANSGELTARLLEELTDLMSRYGIQVIGTEPGTISQQATSVQVRAHLRVRCTYGAFVVVLEELSRSNKLFSVDRFLLNADDSGGQIGEIWVTRYFLKRSGATS